MMPNAWQFRLFVLSKDGILAYYDTEEVSGLIDSNKDRGHIDLKNIQFSLIDEYVEGIFIYYMLIIGFICSCIVIIFINIMYILYISPNVYTYISYNIYIMIMYVQYYI